MSNSRGQAAVVCGFTPWFAAQKGIQVDAMTTAQVKVQSSGQSWQGR
jgi:hypothetical protein